MEEILAVINDRVMDEILTKTFPDICGGNRRLSLGYVDESSRNTNVGRVTGFKFSTETVQESSKLSK
jgi:hypothetical protein